MRRMVQEEAMGWSGGRQTRLSGWEARLLSLVSSLDHPGLTLVLHQVANIEVKLAWQDNRLATTEILVRKSVLTRPKKMISSAAWHPIHFDFFQLNSTQRIGSRESVESPDSMTLSDNSGRPLLEASWATSNSLTPSNWAAAGGLSCSAQFDR